MSPASSATGGVGERRLAMERPAGGEDEQGAPERGIPLGVLERHFLSGDVGEDDQVDVASRSGARLHSSRA